MSGGRETLIGGEDNRVRKRCLHFEEKMEKKNWDCKDSPRRVYCSVHACVGVRGHYVLKVQTFCNQTAQGPVFDEPSLW